MARSIYAAGHCRETARPLSLPGLSVVSILSPYRATAGKGRSRRANLFADVTEGGANYIARHQHQTNLMMIAKQRGQALVTHKMRSTSADQKQCNQSECRYDIVF